MKRAFLLIIFVTIYIGAYSQTAGVNYIQTYNLRVAGYLSDKDITSEIPAGDVNESIEYTDGLGRVIQQVMRRTSINTRDLIVPIVYDALGHDVTNYLPYASAGGTGEYDASFVSNQASFYTNESNVAHDSYPMAPVAYEQSPAGRLIVQGYPGAAGQIGSSHLTEYTYCTNISGHATYGGVSRWSFDASSGNCTRNAEYSTGQLWVAEVKDADGNRTLQFADKEGRTVLKRGINGTAGNVDTYYVYDDFGQLRYIITPEGSAVIQGTVTPTSDNVLKYAYYFSYDKRHRLKTRQVAGRDAEYFVYDKRNRLVLYQDGNMRGQGIWKYVKYDSQNRVVITGITFALSGSTRDALQQQADVSSQTNEYLTYENFNSQLGYSNRVFSGWQSDGYILTVNYYDTYHVWQVNGSTLTAIPLYGNNSLRFSPLSGDNLFDTTHVSGKPTVERVRLGDDLQYQWLTTAQYYDTYGRTIQSRVNNHCSGYDYVSLTYSGLTASPAYVKHQQTARPGTTNYSWVEESWFEYDHAGRLSRKLHKMNNSATRVIAEYSYNALGQAKEKNTKHESATMQSMDYTYNIRGMITGINDAGLTGGDNDLWGMNLSYDSPPSGLSATACYNGNISSQTWQTAGSSSMQKAYAYSYDGLNRMANAHYAEKSGSTWVRNSKYSERSLQYDLNGNIKRLTRRGFTVRLPSPANVDSLTYYYHGNRLIGVNDAVAGSYGGFTDNGFTTVPNENVPSSWEYTYDANGNMLSDKSKSISSIIYNFTNQPVMIYLGDGKRIKNVYDAKGRRLQKIIYSNNGTEQARTDYVANFVYVNNVINHAMMSEGRYVFTSATVFYPEFAITDHLGNVRVTYTNNNGVATLKQSFSYYPYGMCRGETVTTPVNPNEYLYQGKEYDEEHGINMYDFHARMYDPALGCWHVPDPMHQYVSGYVAMGDNPVSAIDPNGMVSIDWEAHMSMKRSIEEASAIFLAWAESIFYEQLYENSAWYSPITGDFRYKNGQREFTEGVVVGYWIGGQYVPITSDFINSVRYNGYDTRNWNEVSNLAAEISSTPDPCKTRNGDSGYSEVTVQEMEGTLGNIKYSHFILFPAENQYEETSAYYTEGYPGYLHGERILSVHHWFTSENWRRDEGRGSNQDAYVAQYQGCINFQHNTNGWSYYWYPDGSSGRILESYGKWHLKP